VEGLPPSKLEDRRDPGRPQLTAGRCSGSSEKNGAGRPTPQALLDTSANSSNGSAGQPTDAYIRSAYQLTHDLRLLFLLLKPPQAVEMHEAVLPLIPIAGDSQIGRGLSVGKQYPRVLFHHRYDDLVDPLG
jgi:hypothetical protein